MDYGNRLANLGLQSLEYRRVCYDLVMCYKIYHNLVDLPFDSFFTKPVRPYYIRGHLVSCDQNVYPGHHTFRAHFFTEYVIPIWNQLPQSTFYAYANSKLNSCVGIPPLLSDDGTLAIEDCEKCELLNKYFVSVYTKDNGKPPHPFSSTKHKVSEYH